ncbi:Dabb family protein [Jannaschia sp. 2305UL9-9]|uniref:Dabb family protein n=1 Tax=Jannaschia sp. 2305UL9-9 TaxID=3121638 RepID=UPI003526EDDF
MILHCVFLNLRGPVSSIVGVVERLASFCEGFPGILAFDHGPNRDFEGKSSSHPYGFVVRFRAREDADRYAAHPEHLHIGRDLVAACVGGAEGILVYDLDV